MGGALGAVVFFFSFLLLSSWHPFFPFIVHILYFITIKKKGGTKIGYEGVCVRARFNLYWRQRERGRQAGRQANVLVYLCVGMTCSYYALWYGL